MILDDVLRSELQRFVQHDQRLNDLKSSELSRLKGRLDSLYFLVVQLLYIYGICEYLVFVYITCKFF